MLSPATDPSSREYAIVFAIALAVAVLGSLPWLAGTTHRPPGALYLGTNVPDVLDSQVYYAFIQANVSGVGLYHNAFTSESQPDALLNPLWWSLGRITALTQVSVVNIFWLAKALFGVGLVIGLHQVLRRYFWDGRWRMVALVLSVFGGGLGGVSLLRLFGSDRLVSIYQDPNRVSALPVDITYAAGFVWFSVLHSPLYVFSIGALLFIGWAFWRSWTHSRWIHAAGAATLVLGFTHPYDLMILFSVGITIIITGILGNLMDQDGAKKILLHLGILFCWALPAIIYYGLLILLVPAIRNWNNQNVLPTSNLRTVVAGFSPMIFFAVIGIKYWWSQQRRLAWIVVAWIAAALGAMYFPLIQYQAKMIIGLGIPVAIVATAGMKKVWETSNRQRRLARSVVVLAILASITTPGIFLNKTIRSQNAEARYFYLDKSLARALTWLRTTTPTKSVVLGDLYTGNLVPQYAQRTAYLGHHHQTAEFQRKLRIVREWFFHDSNQGPQKADWLRQQGIAYVIIGPYERLQGTFVPTSVPGLASVFSDDQVLIFKVQAALGD